MRKKIALTICMIVVCVALTWTIGTAEASPATVISVQPSHVDVSAPGQTFTVNVTITDSPEIIQWMIRVQYDPNILKCILENATTKVPLVDEGGFLNQGGTLSTAFMAKPVNEIDGKITEITDVIMEAATASGNGVLCTLHFNATAAGDSDITIYESALLDEMQNTYPATTQKGTVHVIPEFPAALILPLFLVTTAIIVVVSKTAWTKRRRGYVNVP